MNRPTAAQARASFAMPGDVFRDEATGYWLWDGSEWHAVRAGDVVQDGTGNWYLYDGLTMCRLVVGQFVVAPDAEDTPTLWQVGERRLELVASQRQLDQVSPLLWPGVVEHFLSPTKRLDARLAGARALLPAEPSAEVREQARQLYADGQKIPAIKLVREHTRLGLVEARRYVEALPPVTS